MGLAMCDPAKIAMSKWIPRLHPETNPNEWKELGRCLTKENWDTTGKSGDLTNMWLEKEKNI